MTEWLYRLATTPAPEWVVAWVFFVELALLFLVVSALLSYALVRLAVWLWSRQ